MALTAPTGLSTAQKDRLQRFDPVMDSTNAIPASIAHKDDVTNVISDLASTAAGKGASCIGYEGGTTVQAQVAANTSAISALGGGGNTGFDAETAGAGGQLQLYEATANGTNKVTMASPASLAADRTITVPDADVTLADIATSKAAIDAAVAISAGAGDAGKLAVLDGAGKWDSTMIPAAAPAAHAASHTNGTDDIQDATAGQKGLMTAAYATKLDGIEALADVTDQTNVTTAVGAADAQAVTATSAPANAGKLVKLDGGGNLDGRNLQTDGAVIDTANALISATPSTQLGLERHIKVTTPGGATADTDTVLPPGTWEPTRVEVINRGLGTVNDTVQVVAVGIGAITDVMDINKADATITRPTTFNANSMVGGTNALRVAETDGGDVNSPPVDVHVWLRLVA